MNEHALLTYEECQPNEIERFAKTVAALNESGVQYRTRRANGLIELRIVIGAH